MVGVLGLPVLGSAGSPREVLPLLSGCRSKNRLENLLEDSVDCNVMTTHTQSSFGHMDWHAPHSCGSEMGQRRYLPTPWEMDADIWATHRGTQAQCMVRVWACVDRVRPSCLKWQLGGSSPLISTSGLSAPPIPKAPAKGMTEDGGGLSGSPSVRGKV